jgi:hypothetical protein
MAMPDPQPTESDRELAKEIFMPYASGRTIDEISQIIARHTAPPRTENIELLEACRAVLSWPGSADMPEAVLAHLELVVERAEGREAS